MELIKEQRTYVVTLADTFEFKTIEEAIKHHSDMLRKDGWVLQSSNRIDTGRYDVTWERQF